MHVSASRDAEMLTRVSAFTATPNNRLLATCRFLCRIRAGNFFVGHGVRKVSRLAQITSSASQFRRRVPHGTKELRKSPRHRSGSHPMDSHGICAMVSLSRGLSPHKQIRRRIGQCRDATRAPPVASRDGQTPATFPSSKPIALHAENEPFKHCQVRKTRASDAHQKDRSRGRKPCAS